MARAFTGLGVHGGAGALLALALVSGCGGAGPAAAGPLGISPSTVEVSMEEGASASMTVTATLSEAARAAAAGGPVYVGVQDHQGVLSAMDLTGTSPTTALVTLWIRSTLALGRHTGTMDLYACRDAACGSPFSTVPATLAYTITVTAAPPPPPAVTGVTPSPLVATVEERQQLQLTLDVQVGAGVYVSSYAIVDPQGVFSGAVTRTGPVAGHDTLTLTVAPQPAAGTRTGTLELQACSMACPAWQLPGSPVLIPYQITVTPFEVLPPVPTASGLPEWETFQGTAGHTGHVPATLDPAAFRPRWRWSLPQDAGGALSPVTTGSGRVVVTAAGRFQPAFLFALDELDGAVAWRHDFGSIFTVNHPATAGGRVFVASSGHEDTFMWAFDLADGAQRYQTPFSSQWEHYLAPVFLGGIVYTNGGAYGGLYAFSAASGATQWFAGLGQYDLWTPAVDGQNAYAYTGGELAAIDVLTGSRAFTVPDPGFNWSGYSLNTAPVLPGDGSVVLVDGVFGGGGRADSLIRYRIADGAQDWRVEGHFGGTPAVAAGTIYVVDGALNQIDARDLADGSLRWSWRPADPAETLPLGNLVVTDNLLFVASSAATYAVDLTTRQVAWSTPRIGALAVSSGLVLYVSSPAGTIDAFDLR